MVAHVMERSSFRLRGGVRLAQSAQRKREGQPQNRLQRLATERCNDGICDHEMARTSITLQYAHVRAIVHMRFRWLLLQPNAMDALLLLSAAQRATHGV